jgi:hypothetical protein
MNSMNKENVVVTLHSYERDCRSTYDVMFYSSILTSQYVKCFKKGIPT